MTTKGTISMRYPLEDHKPGEAATIARFFGPSSPDCKADKHRACTGEAWDFVTDSPAPCNCLCHGEVA